MTGLFVFLVILGAYFGGTESAISAMNRIRIKSRADDGDKKAKNALFVSENFDKALTTLLIGNNITHIAAASVATLIATRTFGPSEKVTTICTILTTVIVFLFSEMIPKAFANDRHDTVACAASGILRFLMKVLKPLVAFFTMISNAATKLSDRIFKSEKEPSITEDELYDIIDTIEEEGVMDEEQGDLFKSALDFSETRARNVMTMRDDIVAIDVRSSADSILELIENCNYSRIPVYDGTIDDVIGILPVRSFLKAYTKNKKIRLKSLLLPVYFVSPSAKIDDLLEEMRLHRFWLAVVRDDEGETQGIVTIEDFLEELVGEIYDEDDVVDKSFIKLGGDYFKIDTHMTMKEAFDRMEETFIFPGKETEPVISFVMNSFGRFPDEGESVTVNGLEITVEDVEDRQIPYAVFHILTEEDIAEAVEDEE